MKTIAAPFIVSVLLIALISCGGAKDPAGDVQPITVTIDAPAYTISGAAVNLSASVETSSSGMLVAGRWQIEREAGYRNLTTKSTAIQLQESAVFVKEGTPNADFVQLRFLATAEEGTVVEKEVSLPIYYDPLYVGQDLTLKEGMTVALSMALDEEFQREVSGELDRLSWQQLEGPNVTVDNASSANAEFVAPAVDEITQFKFVAQGEATASGMTFTAEKVVYVVPESEWVDAVAIHHSPGVSAVLRADSSLVVGTSIYQFDFASESVASISGSKASVIALFDDGSARKLYSGFVGDGTLVDSFTGITGIREVGGTNKDSTAREWDLYLSNANDLYLVDSGGSSLLESDVETILAGMGDGYRLTTGGDLVDATGAVRVSSVKRASGSSQQVAYLLDDGTVGHTDIRIPSQHFPNREDYVDVEAGPNDCEAVFAVRSDGLVEFYAPHLHPALLDVGPVVDIITTCQGPMILTSEGVVMTLGEVHPSTPDQAQNEGPSPYNIRTPFIE